MKIFNTLIFALLISMFLISSGTAQEITLQRLDGFEDENQITHLYYEKQSETFCESQENSYYIISSSNIFHFNTSNSSDSLRFFGTKNNINTNGCYIDGYIELTDIQVDGTDSNFVAAIKSGRKSIFDNLIEGSMGMYHPGLHIRFIKHPYSNNKFLFEYLSSFGNGNQTKEMYFHYSEDENPIDTLNFSRNLGYRFMNPSIQRSDSIIFILESDSLFLTKDLNKSTSLSLPNVIDFIDSSNNSLSIYGDSHLNIYHTKNSDLIYWFVDLKDAQSDSAQTYLLKNSSKGEIENWEVSSLFTDIEDPSLNTNNYAVSSDSVLFASSGTKLIQSLNAGDSFKSFITFNHIITGLYAKPDSDILYVLTEKEFFKVENGHLSSIKKVPVSNEETPEIPSTVSLKQNYPNPFNPTTTIEFELDKTTFTKLTVYDVLGRKVRELVNETRPAGTNTIEFNATNLASGVYLYRLEVDGIVQTKRLTLIK